MVVWKLNTASHRTWRSCGCGRARLLRDPTVVVRSVYHFFLHYLFIFLAGEENLPGLAHTCPRAPGPGIESETFQISIKQTFGLDGNKNANTQITPPVRATATTMKRRKKKYINAALNAIKKFYLQTEGREINKDEMQMLSAFFTANAFTKGRQCNTTTARAARSVLLGPRTLRALCSASGPCNNRTLLPFWLHSTARARFGSDRRWLPLAGPARCNVMGVCVRSIEIYCSFFLPFFATLLLKWQILRRRLIGIRDNKLRAQGSILLFKRCYDILTSNDIILSFLKEKCNQTEHNFQMILQIIRLNSHIFQIWQL